ncbi:uncharacterized protein METZ01_LOCUS41595 [marine metagenome]|uniref:Primosomal protein n=1 Tax=marine metagenome TaxID=408172 RepID=A0A381RAU0_9ZZZZ|tara:strand:- start:1414 stop:2061 length:648 start_codon:yes stop_codon:yes gene_type:complete
MKLITEVSEALEYVAEEGKDGTTNYKIRGIFMQAEQMNRNKRTYPLSVLESEVKRYNKEYVNKNRAFGELGHPDGPTVNLDRVSHMITKLDQEKNDFVGEAKILNTPNGKIVRELISAGATLGVSSRGMGSLTPTRNGSVVGNDYYLSTAGDIVADPSAPNAFVEGIMEGKEWVWDNGIIKETEIDKYKQSILSATSVTLDDAKLNAFADFISKL